VSDVKLLQGDLAEAWREGDTDYATVAMRFSLNDETVDRDSGRVVQGGPDEATEVWTFMRVRGGHWLVSAIQQAERGHALSTTWPGIARRKMRVNALMPGHFFDDVEAQNSDSNRRGHRSGLPYPPAVGGWMMIASPASMTVASQPASFSTRPSLRRT